MHCNLIIENIEKMNEVREKLNSIFKEGSFPNLV